MTISNEATVVALQAWRATPFGGDALMNALEAAAPIIRAEAIREAADEMRAERHSWCLDDAGRYWIKRTLDELAERGRQ